MPGLLDDNGGEQPFGHPLIRSRTAQHIHGLRQRMADTAEAYFLNDAYEVWRTMRPDIGGGAWDEEPQSMVEDGYGQLRRTGNPGGDQGSDNVFVGLSPYTFRMPTTTLLTKDDELIVNGRQFIVDAVTRGDVGDRFAEAAVQERYPFAEPVEPEPDPDSDPEEGSSWT